MPQSSWLGRYILRSVTDSMAGIFEDILPVSKRRTTRSQAQWYQKIKKVTCNVSTDNFEHFTKMSLNTRISGLMNSDSEHNPVILGTPQHFLANRNVCEKSSILCVTIKPKKSPRKCIGSHTKVVGAPQQCLANGNVSEKSSMLSVKSKHKSPRKSIASATKIVGKLQKTRIQRQLNRPSPYKINPKFETNNESCDDDVVIINPTDDSVVVIDDSIIIPNLDSEDVTKCISPVTKSPKENKKSSTIVNVTDDEDEDVVFIKEEKHIKESPKNIGKLPRKPNKLNLLNVRKNKRKRKKKQLTKANLKFLCANSIAELIKKRCTNCRNMNSEMAKSCPCNNSFIHKFWNAPNLKLQTPQQLVHSNLTQMPSMSRSPCKLVNNNVTHTTNVQQGSPKLKVTAAIGSSTVNTVNGPGLREIVIDGSNVAFGHSNGRCFSVKGLQIAIDYFVNRGHKVVAFVPQFRQKHNQTTDTHLLNTLADRGLVVFTPSREVNGRRITPYDDRYIIQYAAAREGIVVSSDNYRDLFIERPDWRMTIEKRLLMPTWVGDMLMFPEDPLGRHGPNLTRFLKFP